RGLVRVELPNCRVWPLGTVMLPGPVTVELEAINVACWVWVKSEVKVAVAPEIKSAPPPLSGPACQRNWPALCAKVEAAPRSRVPVELKDRALSEKVRARLAANVQVPALVTEALGFMVSGW